VNEQNKQCSTAIPTNFLRAVAQRVMIAMAISCNPTVLIARTTTALDVTVQATILDLLSCVIAAK